MGIAYFEKGQNIRIENDVYKLFRKIDPDIWQLESEKTGRIIEKGVVDLLDDFASSLCSFVIHDKNEKESIYANDWSDKQVAALDCMSEEDQLLAKARYAYMCEVKSSKIPFMTAKYIEPIIEIVWSRTSKPDKKPHWITVYRWWKRFRNSGEDIRSLVTKNLRKGNRTRRYPNELLFIIEQAVNSIFMSRERGTIQDTLDNAIYRVRTKNQLRPSRDLLPLPTYSLVRSTIRKIPAFDRHAARYGWESARNKYRSDIYCVHAERPLERVEIDHTKVNLFVIDEETMLPLGRPWLTVCIDNFSRCVLGFYVGFEPPSSLTVARCLKHAFLPKTYIRTDYPDLKNNWDCFGVMETLVVDNGLEFHAKSLEAVALTCGIVISYNPRKTAWFKGKIERLAGTMNRGIAHGVPGTTFHNIIEKDDYDAAKNATITLSSLKHIIHIWVVDYYHQRMHSSLDSSPSKVWDENISIDQIPLPVGHDDIDALLGQIIERTLTHKGIEQNLLFYNSIELQEVRIMLGDGIKVTIRYDDGDLGHIYVIHPETNRPIKVKAKMYEYANGLTSWQHKVCKKFARLFYKGRNKLEALAEAKEKIRGIVEQDFFNKKTKSRARLKRFIGDRKFESNDKKTSRENNHNLEKASVIHTDVVGDALSHDPNLLDVREDEVFSPRILKVESEKRISWSETYEEKTNAK